MIELLVNGSKVQFETTIFPDGTSQVWKVEQDLEASDEIKILWLFEKESELMHVCQLATLTQLLSGQSDSTLVVPYLPYARQDKEVSNTSSFSLHVFTQLTYAVNICRIETFDAHSKVSTNNYIESASPNDFHQSILKHDVICFPDKGALTRYQDSFPGYPFLYCEKIRNQLTGEITGLAVKNPSGVNITDLDVLIVDDICDGGMTFIKVAEALKEAKPHTIDLAVSHGLFSKGTKPLYQAGISNIYTTNSLLQNKDGFKVW